MDEVLRSHRRRRHWHILLQQVEDELESIKGQIITAADVVKWKCRTDTYKPRFRSKDTWLQIRENHPRCGWDEVAWFKYSTPKYSFLFWTVMHDRISTGERMLTWNANVDPSCVLCNHPLETTQHLFFECSYSAHIWEALVKGILRENYTANWNVVLCIIKNREYDKLTLFLLRYSIHATMYGLWRERNARRHGEAPSPPQLLIKTLDKAIRNRLSTIKSQGDKEFDEGLTLALLNLVELGFQELHKFNQALLGNQV
ncbi:uncharacterized protein LOC112082824 [Eutrema salsugineum]|uniref:uncharacterized protein LOC112082824 n=1 Tax=Eutrema salsugineum TaxID=72664 RepID=UPI000CED4B58|nr:uncharacterized protein LOC112082824 [Eutrema salsugineum]